MKDEFLRYLGESNSLTGYRKSNRLVLLSTLFSLIDVTGKAVLIDVVKAYRKYYLFRKNNGYITDFGADDAINNVDISTDAEILTVIKRHPFRVLQERNFLEIQNISGIDYFVFNKNLIGELCADDISDIKDVIEKKLRLYFLKVDENEKHTNDSGSVNEESEQLHIGEDIEIIGLSARSHRWLKEAGIKTIEKLSVLDDQQLFSMKNIGKTSVDEIKAALKKYLKSEISTIHEVQSKPIKSQPISKAFRIWLEDLLEINNYYKDENAELTNEEYEILKAYEDAIHELGLEICRQSYEHPEVGISIIQMLNDFSCSIEAEHERFSKITESFNNIFFDNKNAKIKPLIRAFISDEKTHQTMLSLFDECDKVSAVVKHFSIISNNDVLWGGFVKLFNRLQEDIKKVLSGEIKNIYKNERQYEIIKACANGATFKYVGDKLNLTRSRVQQVDAKVGHAFASFYSRNKPANILFAFSNSTIGFTENDIKNIFRNEADVFTYYIKKKDFKELTWSNEFECFIIGNASWYYNMMSKIENLPDQIYYMQIDELVSSVKEIIRVDIEDAEIKEVVLSFYKQVGDYYTKSRITKKDMYKIIVEKYYQNGIKLFDEFDMMRFKARLEDAFGEIKWNTEATRSISSRITDFTVLCDRGRYILPSQIRIDPGLLDEIHNFVHNHDRPSIMFVEIFEVFKERLLSESNIDNRYFLQGVLKHYWKDEFSFSRDTISRGSGEERNIRNYIEEFIKNSDQPITIKEIKKEFLGITDIVVNMAILEDSDILQWGFGEYIHASLFNISDEDIAKLKGVLELLLEDGTVSSRALYEQIFGNGQELLNKNKIHNHIALFSVCQYLYPDDYSFSRPYISNGNTGTTADAVIEEYVANFDELSIADLKLFFDDKHMKIMNFSAMLNKNCRDFLRCDDDMLIRLSKLSINESIINDVQNSIISTLGDKGYIAACNYNDFFFFPYIGVKWTGYMLVSFVKCFCDKLMISQYSLDHRYLTEIIVKCDIGINNHNELIRYAIKFEDIKAKFDSIVEVEEFLKKEGLIANTASIPPVLFQNGTIEIAENGGLKTN